MDDNDGCGCVATAIFVIVIMALAVSLINSAFDKLDAANKFENRTQLVHATCYSGDTVTFDENIYRDKGNFYPQNYDLNRKPIYIVGCNYFPAFPEKTRRIESMTHKQFPVDKIIHPSSIIFDYDLPTAKCIDWKLFTKKIVRGQLCMVHRETGQLFSIISLIHMKQMMDVHNAECKKLRKERQEVKKKKKTEHGSNKPVNLCSSSTGAKTSE